MNALESILFEKQAEREETPCMHTTGTVTGVADSSFNVHTPAGVYRARRAVSCLVMPEDGDQVLIAGANPFDLFILAVLHRPGAQAVRIAPEGDLTVELKSGQFSVAATEGVNLISKKDVSVAADRLEVRAGEGKFFFSCIKLIAKAVDSVLDRISQRAKQIYRRVEEIEHVRAGQVDCASRGNMRLHGNNTLLTANELVKAEGKQIHIG